MKHLVTLFDNLTIVEILNGCRRYSTKYDMWSVGLILTEMTQGRRLYFQKFKDTDLREQYFKEEKHLEPLQKCTMSKQMYKMIRRCLK
jgi:serine/threonine protein kinase